MRTLAEITQRLRWTLRRKGQTCEDAEDFVQEAMLRYEVYQRTHAVDNRESFITQTAFNLAVDASRRVRRSPISKEPFDHRDRADPLPGPAEHLLARRSLERLKAGLAAMDPRTQDIILAHRLGGLTYAEIARREGLSESAILKRMARGMLFLQEWMEE